MIIFLAAVAEGSFPERLSFYEIASSSALTLKLASFIILKAHKLHIKILKVNHVCYVHITGCAWANRIPKNTGTFYT